MQQLEFLKGSFSLDSDSLATLSVQFMSLFRYLYVYEILKSRIVKSLNSNWRDLTAFELCWELTVGQLGRNTPIRLPQDIGNVDNGFGQIKWLLGGDCWTK